MKKVNTKVVPDAEIDTSDIPEITDWSGAVRGLFARPETRQISIRLVELTNSVWVCNSLMAARAAPSPFRISASFKRPCASAM